MDNNPTTGPAASPSKSWAEAYSRHLLLAGGALFAVATVGGLAHDVLAERRLPPPNEQPFRKADKALASGDLALAREQYTIGTKIRPDLDQGFLGLARALEIAGTPEERIENWERLLSVNPQHREAHARLAEILGHLGRVEESIPHLATLAELEPQNGDIAYAHGLALRRAGRSGPAADELLRAAVLKPEAPEHHNALGIAWIEIGDLRGAVEAFQNAVRLAPGQEGYRQNLEAAKARLAEGERP